MKTGKITKQAAGWIRKNPTLNSALHTFLQQPNPRELSLAYKLYNQDTHGLQSEMTQEDLNKYLQVVRDKQRGEY